MQIPIIDDLFQGYWYCRVCYLPLLDLLTSTLWPIYDPLEPLRWQYFYATLITDILDILICKYVLD